MTTLLQPPIWTIGAWSANVVDVNGVMWVSPSSTGWFDPLPVRGSDIDIPTEDGSYSTPTTRGERVITIPGYAKAPSQAAADAACDQFTSLLYGGLDTLSVQENSRVLTARVKLGNGCQLDRTSPTGLEWQLVLIAPDPYRYLALPSQSTGLPAASGGVDYTGAGAGGVDYTGAGAGGVDYGLVTSTGLIQLTNPGVADAWPKFTISGPTDGATLTNPIVAQISPAQQLAYTNVLQTGDTLVIDTNPRHRSVLLNGVSYGRFLTSRQWFRVPPGQSITCQFQGVSASMTPVLTASLSAAF